MPKATIVASVRVADKLGVVGLTSKQPRDAYADLSTFRVIYIVIQHCAISTGGGKSLAWEYLRETIFITRSPTTSSGRELMAMS
jgi:hypothetical protein